MGFTRAELEAFRDAEVVPDLVGPDLRLLFVGINPGLWTAAVRTPFAHPGNRFYPALVRAGILDELPPYAEGFSDDDRRRFVDRGLGITNLVKRATARADELSAQELRDGAARLERELAVWQPKVAAVVGITAYRQAFRRPKAKAGRQPDTLAGVELWVVPQPSGLNAHETIGSLAEAYAGPARAAGVIL